MTVTTQPVVGTVPPAVGALAPQRKKASWGGIFAGTVIGLAIMVMLGLLGAGIGLWATEPGGETDSIATMSTVSAIYFVVCQLIALAIGGYAASRMSATWDRQNAMLHGASVWGLTTLAAVYLATSGATLLYNNTVSAISRRSRYGAKRRCGGDSGRPAEFQSAGTTNVRPAVQRSAGVAGSGCDGVRHAGGSARGIQ